MTGQELLDRMVAFIRRYVALTEGQALVCALWALNTWTYDRFAAVPYLEIWAAHKRSGKSTLAEILSSMSQGGAVLATTSGVSLARAIEAFEGRYTPFIEEAEKFSKATLGNDRSILATGYRRGASHTVTTGKGEVLRFRTYSPKAFVLIGNVHEILHDRCISVKLTQGQPVGNWTLDREMGESEGFAIVESWRKVAKGLDVVNTDGNVRFKVIDPDWLMSSRDREIWSPLFSLAAALRCNGATLNTLTRASVDMSELKTQPLVKYHPSADVRVNDDMDAATAVLRDCLAVIGDAETFIPTEVLLTRLHGIATSPWRSWRGVGLDDQTLPQLLTRFGITPDIGQVGKGRKDRKVIRGYKVAKLRSGYKVK